MIHPSNKNWALEMLLVAHSCHSSDNLLTKISRGGGGVTSLDLCKPRNSVGAFKSHDFILSTPVWNQTSGQTIFNIPQRAPHDALVGLYSTHQSCEFGHHYCREVYIQAFSKARLEPSRTGHLHSAEGFPPELPVLMVQGKISQVTWTR